MRKALVFLLLVSAAAPAFASAGIDERSDRRAERAERPERAQRANARRAERDDDDGEQAQRAVRAAPPQPAMAEERRVTRDERGDGFREQRLERRAARAGDGEAAPVHVRQRRGAAPAGVTDWRARERFSAGTPTLVQQRNRDGADVLRQRVLDQYRPAVSRVPREGTQPPSRVRSSRYSGHHWRGDWRNDRRYDWRNHRRRYSSLFNFGFYHDPFGWNYRPFSIGWRMWPSYYSRSYWLNDPWQYRLPYAPPGYRWIRYYDDAILVDTWDGRVVDVIRSFFW